MDGENIGKGAVGFYVVMLLLMSSSVSSFFLVEQNSIDVIAPYSLRGKRNSSIGNFGVPGYGGTMIGQLVYPEKGKDGCKSFEELGVSFSKSDSRILFLLVDRGECMFLLKAWNAQNAGAAAVLVADYVDESLETMSSPEEYGEKPDYLNNISIPSALIEMSFGFDLKKALQNGDIVTIKLDWTEAMPHPDARVEYELWTSSNDECGPICDDQMDFVRNFKGHAQILEKAGHTLFTPHYITWSCPKANISSKWCESACINHGRYCAPDHNLGEGYEGKDVVNENLRQLCAHRVANESGRPWVWWDYVTDFQIRCPMKDKKYNQECAEEVIKSLGLSVDKVRDCTGDPEADADNPVLKAQLEAQVGKGSRGDITMLPTLVINDVQCRGKLERTAVLKALCAGFKETTESRICLSGDIETNECLTNNGGCWLKTKDNTTISACKDTFRGRVCECPSVCGVQFRGNGYVQCEAYGPTRCMIKNGFCWSETRNGKRFSACLESQHQGCQCPPGFKGDGQNCEDIDECKERSACQCSGCHCNNKWGGYDCKCKGGHVYIAERDTCVGRNSSRFGWFLTLLVLVGLVSIGVVGYVFYKYRIRSYMDSEIMAVMSQYMPLVNQNEIHQPLQPSSV